MNKLSSTLVKMVVLATILASFSCKQKRTSSILVLEDKNKFESYQIHEQPNKVDSNSEAQCENFFQFKSTDSGFEMYGANIADVFSQIKNKSRSNVVLKNENNSFYSIVYKGKNSDSASKIILNKLLDLKGLKIDSIKVKDKMYTLENIDYQKLNRYVNYKDIEPKYYLADNFYKLENATIPILLSAVNDMFPKTFSTNYSDQKEDERYNIEIPVGKNKNEIVNLLKNQYGITFILKDSEYVNYIIEKR